MKILVYDIAAEDGGGLFVLKNFYEQVRARKEEQIEWIFMTSFPLLEEIDSIKVMTYKWIKRSWLHRIFFENFILPGIVKEIQPDLVLSLQNMPIMHCNAKQMVYLHQSLQYCPKKFSFFKDEERSLAIRQRIICNMYKYGLKKAEHIFVQTQWIKDATKEWIDFPEEKITVVPVALGESPISITPYVGYGKNVFFYPARAEIYKNHEVIIQACRLLEEEGIRNYEVIFTVKPEDNSYVMWLQKEAKGLPIKFIGQTEYDGVWEYYLKSVLIFPSYLETCGLPLLEAKIAGSIILTSDMPFSHEALEDYENAQYFSYDNPDMLASMMKRIVKKEIAYISPKQNKDKAEEKDLLSSVLEQMQYTV